MTPKSSRGQERREVLFNLYSKNMSFYNHDVGDAFVCPLCLKTFYRDALSWSPQLLTLAHIVPKCLGGKDTTLACFSCNTRGGTELETFLQRWFRRKDAFAGIGDLKARMKAGGHEIRADVRILNKSQWHVFMVRDQSDPKALSAVEGWLKEHLLKQTDEAKFQLKFLEGQSPRRVRSALLQSAYLLMFSYFGYEAVSHSHYKPIREWLLNPANDELPCCAVEMGEEGAADMLRGRQQALVFMDSPPAILAVLALKAQKGRKRIVGVVLPGLDSPDTPLVELGESESTLVHYRPDALLEGPGYLKHLWNRHCSRRV